MGVLARWSHGHSQTLVAKELLQAQQVCNLSGLSQLNPDMTCHRCSEAWSHMHLSARNVFDQLTTLHLHVI